MGHVGEEDEQDQIEVRNSYISSNTNNQLKSQDLKVNPSVSSMSNITDSIKDRRSEFLQKKDGQGPVPVGVEIYGEDDRDGRQGRNGGPGFNQQDAKDILAARKRAVLDQSRDEQANWPQSPWRWVNLVCVFMALAASASCMTTFSSISTQIAHAYGTDDLVVNSATIVYFASYILTNFPSVFAMEAGTQGFGLKLSVSSPYTIFVYSFLINHFPFSSKEAPSSRSLAAGAAT